MTSPQSALKAKTVKSEATDLSGNQSALYKSLKRAGRLQSLASLLWLPQAALLGFVVQQYIDANTGLYIYLSAAAIFVIGVLRSVMDAAGSKLAFETARQNLSVKRGLAIDALVKASPLDRNRIASGEAASIVAEQAELIVPYLSKFVPVRQKVMIVPLVFLIATLWFSWIAALILFIAAPLIPIFMALIGMKAQKASEEQLLEVGGMNGFLLDRLRGLATIRSFDAVDATANRLRANAETVRKKTMAVLKIAFLTSAVLELFSALGVAMVAVYIGFHLLGTIGFGSWGGQLSLGEGLFILLLAPTFFEPLRELSNVWHDRASGEAAIKALDNLSSPKSALLGIEQQGYGQEIIAAPTVKFDNIAFHYDNGAPVLQDFNLEIKSGEHVAIMAPSGYGKSTILALLAGLIIADRGSIHIGKFELNNETSDDLRHSMAWIGQKPHIFSGSPKSNVTLSRSFVTDDIFQSAVHSAGLGNIDAIFAHDHIGESGIGLSGGEALRLAIARAAANPDATLILADEPTAHLDRRTAQSITDNLIQFADNKTMIVVTHDQKLADRMDRIIVLDLPKTDEELETAGQCLTQGGAA